MITREITAEKLMTQVIDDNPFLKEVISPKVNFKMSDKKISLWIPASDSPEKIFGITRDLAAGESFDSDDIEIFKKITVEKFCGYIQRYRSVHNLAYALTKLAATEMDNSTSNSDSDTPKSASAPEETAPAKE